MGHPEKTHVARAMVKIAGSTINVGKNLRRLEWVSFVNGGYHVSVHLLDANFAILRDIVTQKFLEKARKDPTPIEFQFEWVDGSGKNKTDVRLAYATSIRSKVDGNLNVMVFEGIDPPSWWLNAGESEGKIFTGNLTKVIKDVATTYYVAKEKKAKVEVSETIDSKENKWPMFRMDPKTFIQSLIHWSSSLTKKKTHWIVASVDKELIIKEQADLKDHNKGAFSVNVKSPAANDIYEFELLSDNFITTLQSQLITQGISAISGEYYDKITQKEKMTVKDENTKNKVNAKIGADRGYKKPDDKYSTSILSVPEHSGGEVGVEYIDYADGKARDLFLNMLNLVMRMRFRTSGDKKFDNSSQLGKSVIFVEWKDIDKKAYFLHGNWLVYGFRHILSKGFWTTDLYCARLDYDAEVSQKLQAKIDKGDK